MIFFIIIWGLWLFLNDFASSKWALEFVPDCGMGANQPFVFTDANYFLSVIPFLAAVDSGVLGITSDQFTILPPPRDQSKFCYSVSDCKELLGETMDSWNTFFEVFLLSFIPHSSDRQRQCLLWKSFVKDCFYELYTFLNILNIIANRYFTHKWCRNTVHASETQCQYQHRIHLFSLNIKIYHKWLACRKF